MSGDSVYLTVEQVVALHHRSIERYGGLQGLRDQGALESAVAQPAVGFGGLDAGPLYDLTIAVATGQADKATIAQRFSAWLR